MQLEALQEQVYSAQSVQDSGLQKQDNTKLQRSENAAERRKSDGFIGDCPACQCEKCRSRRYQDGSNDSRVSFQMPTVMDPVKARTKVMSHEMEHVRNEQHKAKKEDKIVVSQSVRIMTDRCEECGSSYVKGGFTRTITRPKLTDFRKMLSGLLDGSDDKKKLIGIA